MWIIIASIRGHLLILTNDRQGQAYESRSQAESEKARLLKTRPRQFDWLEVTKVSAAGRWK